MRTRQNTNEDSSVWPLVLVIYQPGFHDDLPALFQVILNDVRIKTVNATNQDEVLDVLKTQAVDLFIVAGCGNGCFNSKTGHIYQPPNGPAQFDGLKLGKLVRKKYPDLEGIFTSGYFINEHILAEIDRCGMAFLPKPFNLQELLELVLLLLWKDGKRACCPSHFFSCARIHQSAGDLHRALSNLNQAISLNPADADALNHRSEVKWDLGDYGGAAADSGAALKIVPGFKEAYFNRGVAWWALGEQEKALGDFDKTIQLDPELGMAYYYRSSIKWGRRDYDGALSDLNHAESTKRFQPTANFYEERGDVKNALGDLDGAIADYDRAIGIKNGHASGDCKT